MMDMKAELASGQIILMVTSKSKYLSVVGDIHDGLSGLGTLGYVTVNKPYATICKDLEKKGINPKEVFFVDAITATVQAPPIVNNCYFVASPTSLTDLSLSFSSLASENNCEIIFFDTISTLMVYQDIGTVIKFVHNLITKIRVLGKKLVFLAFKEDSEELIKDLNMFVDKVIEL